MAKRRRRVSTEQCSPGIAKNTMSTNTTDFTTDALTIDEKRFFPESTFILWWEKVFLTILVVIFGMIGNLLSFTLLSRRRFRNSAAAFYMRALSLSDAGVIIGLVGNHTMRMYQVQMHSAIYCKTIYFLIKWLMAVSDWILGAMCLERSIAISLPLKSKRFLKPRNNRIALGCILAMLAVYYAYTFEAYGATQGVCRTVSMSYPVVIRTMVDYALVLLPMFLIISSNIVIIISVIRAARHQHTLTGSSSESSASSSTQMSLIAMLITISIAFVVLKSPHFLVKAFLPESLTKQIGYQFTSRMRAIYRLMIGIFTANGYINHAVNFYLYMLSGREYRKELKTLVKSVCKRQTDQAAPNTASSTLPNNGAD
ncbi:hypothetical protein CAPTEDRAFT_188645 [Capitella teleta]|uniref:G-protein coupled receptors family 1 profile domain-containing protein n=1 Tax=Capitella teleta TaxID=283909 RepID=R7UZZ6_CAPTE|nr:hypothetical protein CAPTEDRAFT_188645 [Capitella teleta]|eukprot:ELU11837.1 hypothetical protein CAPTEDRAFT_188645 [Capitella teleta]